MRIVVLFISLCLLYSSCGHENSVKNNTAALEVKSELTKDRHNITKITIDEIKLDSLLTPEGFVLNVPDVSEFTDCYFYPDSIFVELYGLNYGWRIGKWFLRNDTIFTSYFKEITKKGLGEPEIIYLEETSGKYKEELYRIYPEYATHISQLDKQNYKSFFYSATWSNIKTLLKTDNAYSFSKINTDISNFDITLPGKYTIASYRKLDLKNIESFNKNELRLMRNEIFARYGYIFNSKELTDYFKQFDWYKPNKKNVDIYLSEIEKANVKLIIESENPTFN